MSAGPIEAIVGRELDALWHGLHPMFTSAVETGMYVVTWGIVAALFYGLVIRPAIEGVPWRNPKTTSKKQEIVT